MKIVKWLKSLLSKNKTLYSHLITDISNIVKTKNYGIEDVQKKLTTEEFQVFCRCFSRADFYLDSKVSDMDVLRNLIVIRAKL